MSTAVINANNQVLINRRGFLNQRHFWPVPYLNLDLDLVRQRLTTVWALGSVVPAFMI